MAVIPSKPNTKLMWASQGNRAEPTSDKQLDGWTQEIPPHEMENWVQYKQDLAIKYLYQEGIPEWDSSFEYNTTSFVKYNGIIYKLAKSAEVPNVGKQPDVSTTSWEIAFEPYGASSNSAEEIRKIKEIEGYLSLYVSKSKPVMNGIATAPEFQATANGGHTFQGAGTDSGMFLNENNEPEFRINNTSKAVVRNNPSLMANDNTLVTMAMLQEFKASLMITQFPIGMSIITQDPRNPRDYLGFGQWERDLEGRALVGYSSDVTNATPDWKKRVNSVYGSDTQTLTSEQVPPHKHNILISRFVGGDDAALANGSTEGYPLMATRNQRTGAVSKNGIEAVANVGGQPFNITQSSKVKFIWTRIA